MNKWEKRMELVKKLQEEIDRRTRVEKAVVVYITAGRFEEANVLLESIDDDIVRKIEKELNELDAEQKEEALTVGADVLVDHHLMMEKSREAGVSNQEALLRYAERINKKVAKEEGEKIMIKFMDLLKASHKNNRIHIEITMYDIAFEAENSAEHFLKFGNGELFEKEISGIWASEDVICVRFKEAQ